ncbi:hypothetical protein [Mycobacterium sp. TY815]|uniref:hypothetical protein n=1 Tax=Mycobacterium sp. TY815 TaxID=3050581 RepID=UPI002740DB5D|nr:hypothetical protein [Mycobacterium sp. TY815]MDP7707446.1 hypothetical protein [Mycobacterium sp. TY815]
MATDVYENCKTPDAQWSVVTSAGPNATLATVLAGFMLTAAIFLLRKDGAGETPSVNDARIYFGGRDKIGLHTYTLALFGPGVLILGLDSYLFGHISAMAPILNERHEMVSPTECGIAWTQTLPASSMLALGGCLMIAGLSWMLAQYFVSQDEPSGAILKLPGLLSGVVIAATSLLLVQTANVYLDVMADSFHAPAACCVRSICQAAYFIIPLVIICMAGINARRFSMHVLAEKSRDGLDAAPDLHLEQNFKYAARASFFTVLLAFLGPLFFGLVANRVGINADGTPKLCTVYAATFLGLAPIAIMFLIALASPAAPPSTRVAT